MDKFLELAELEISKWETQKIVDDLEQGFWEIMDGKEEKSESDWIELYNLKDSIFALEDEIQMLDMQIMSIERELMELGLISQ